MLTSTPPRYRLWTRLGITWLVFLGLLSLYWLRLDVSYQNQLNEAQKGAQLRGSQAAHALSMQVHGQLMSIDFVLERLAWHWLDQNKAQFNKLIDHAQQGIFNGALDAITVADANGNVLFESAPQQALAGTVKSIADRRYFKHVAQPGSPHLLISQAESDTFSQRRTVQFSYKIIIDGQFAGAIIASVASELLAQAFSRIYSTQDDVVLLTLNDGQYLARTHGLDALQGEKTPTVSEFIDQPDRLNGYYNLVAPIDGIERFYAWHRVPDFPLVLSLGLGKENVLAPVLLAINDSKTQNVIASALLILAALWISYLTCIKANQNRSLLQTKERLATLLNRVPAAVLLEDENNTVVTVNTYFCTLFNLDQSPQSLMGLEHAQLLTMLSPEQAAWLTLPDAQLKQSKAYEVDDNAGRSFRVDWVPIQREQRYLGHVWFIHDVSLRKRKNQELLMLATTDALTGLHNRRSFLEILQQHMLVSEKEASGALLLLDIDHFKKINDTYGHPTGDLVIQNITQAMREALRKDDFSGRIGGEEFAILLPKVTLKQALELAERIRKRIASTPTTLQTDSIYATVSIGVASLYQQDISSVQSQADKALYLAKNTGRNRVRCAVFAPTEAPTVTDSVNQ